MPNDGINQEKNFIFRVVLFHYRFPVMYAYPSLSTKTLRQNRFHFVISQVGTHTLCILSYI